MLGIETSCDETAAGIVLREADGTGRILANAVRLDIEAHAAFGGIVPEIAARSHVQMLDALILQALGEAGLRLDEVDDAAELTLAPYG